MTADPRFAPHRVLASHYPTAADKQRYLRRLFDQSAVHYDRILGWGFFGSGDWYRLRALQRAGLAAGMTIGDVGTGTGATARAAAAITGDAARVTCIEPSRRMREELAKKHPFRCLEGSAEAIPLPDGGLDFLSMGFALRHVDDLKAAFAEFRRVLKPGGRLLILEITKPERRLPRLAFALYFRDLLPRFARLLTGSRETATLMRYYWATLDGMVAPERVLEALRAAGFANFRHQRELGIFSEYTAINPEPRTRPCASE